MDTERSNDDLNIGSASRLESIGIPSAEDEVSSVASSSRPELECRWLSAHFDPLSTIYTFSSCICLADLNGDGEYRLIIAEFGTGTYNMKLKVYKGTSLQSEHTLIDLPTGVIPFHMNSCDSRTPAIAVASGSNIYIYKNLRPFYKFTLPTLEINPAEMDAWYQVKEEKIDISSLREVLENIRADIGESNLTSRTQRFLMLDPDEAEEFSQTHKNHPLKKQTIITALGSMKKSLSEEGAVSCLVLGTESRHIYVLEPDAFTILAAVSLPSVPVFLNVSGLFDVEYRIVVSCRNGALYTIKRGFKTGKLCTELSSQPVGLMRANNNIIIGCMDQSLNCYSTKGKCLWSLKLPDSIVALECAEVQQLGLRLCAVALGNGLVHFYHDKCLVDILAVEDVVTALKFGRFGREENTLVMITRGGALMVKILKRTAVFEGVDLNCRSLPSQNVKLNIPKKTKLFVDQTMREREQCTSMHRTFQHDLFRLRLTTARAYTKALSSSLNPVTFSASEPLKLSAEVQGLGPIFMLRMKLQNTSSTQPSVQLCLAFTTNSQIYSIERNFIMVPFLAPGLVYSFLTKVQCVSDLNVSDIIKVLLVRQGEGVPLLSAVISMPVSEGLAPT